MGEDDDFDDDYDDSYDDDDAYEEKETFDDDDWFADDDAYEEKEAFDDDDWFDDDDGDDDSDVGATPVNSNNDNTYASTNENSKSSRSTNIDPISISALIIGTIAIAIGIANLLYFNNLKKKFQI